LSDELFPTISNYRELTLREAAFFGTQSCSAHYLSLPEPKSRAWIAARVLGVTPRSSIRPPSLRPSIRSPCRSLPDPVGVCFSIVQRGDLPRSRSVRRNGLMSDLVEHRDPPAELARIGGMRALNRDIELVKAARRLIPLGGFVSLARERTRSVFRPKLEVGKSCHQRCLQKLEMRNGCSKFVQSSLSANDFGTEQILIVIVLLISR
jgi:hypothetical protein